MSKAQIKLNILTYSGSDDLKTVNFVNRLNPT